MAEKWKYIGTVLLPADLPTGVLDEWKATLKGEQARIYASLLAKIPDEASFQDYIGDASSDAYAQFLATVGGAWDVDVIEMKQRVKLARKYTDWKAGIENAFKVGGYFPDRVDSKADKFKLARYVMGAVGHRATVGGSFGVWNPASVGVLLLRGDTRPARYFDANDTFSGTLESVTEAIKGRLIAPSILAHAVYGCVMAKFANEGALTALRDTIISSANTVIDALLQVALDATHLGVGYDVTYALSWYGAGDNVRITVTDTHP